MYQPLEDHLHHVFIYKIFVKHRISCVYNFFYLSVMTISLHHYAHIYPNGGLRSSNAASPANLPLSSAQAEFPASWVVPVTL